MEAGLVRVLAVIEVEAAAATAVVALGPALISTVPSTMDRPSPLRSLTSLLRVLSVTADLTVEAAKLLYKAEKERYRAEREERRRTREVRIASNDAAQTLVDTSTPDKAAEAPAAKPAVHLVSAGNPKVGYPPLEMYSVPHRSNTYHGRPTRRFHQEVVVETPAERTIHRITKRLAAMGITEKAHPSLPAKIKEQLPEGTVSEDAENNIVSTLVEELLFMSPKPAASGSGLRDGDGELPGAWP